MKYIATIIFFMCGLVISCAAQDEAKKPTFKPSVVNLPDGFYPRAFGYIKAKVVAKKVITTRGSIFDLTSRVSPDIKYKYVSADSKDKRFSCLVICKGSTISKKVIKPEYILVVNKTAYAPEYSQKHINNMSSRRYELPSRKAAQEVAKFLNIKVREVSKRPPDSLVQVTFTPDKKEYAAGAEVNVEMTIKNVGKEPVAFLIGCRNRGSRDNQFVFMAYRNSSRTVKDIGSTLHFGGLGRHYVLLPDEEFKKSVCLNKWFTFFKGGGYEIFGMFYMDYSDPADTYFSYIWSNIIASKFNVTVKGNLETEFITVSLINELKDSESKKKVGRKGFRYTCNLRYDGRLIEYYDQPIRQLEDDEGDEKDDPKMRELRVSAADMKEIQKQLKKIKWSAEQKHSSRSPLQKSIHVTRPDGQRVAFFANSKGEFTHPALRAVWKILIKYEKQVLDNRKE